MKDDWAKVDKTYTGLSEMMKAEEVFCLAAELQFLKMHHIRHKTATSILFVHHICITSAAYVHHISIMLGKSLRKRVECPDRRVGGCMGS